VDAVLTASRLTGPGTLEGEVGGARYYIEVPEDWNGDLVLYAHGYVPPVVPIEGVDPASIEPGKRAEVLARGYAWAASARPTNGFAVQEGARVTHQLRGIFTSRVRRPGHVYLSSTSMGALIILRLLEEHPGMYAGALPVCGPLAGAAGFWSGSFHTRALFDYYYPGVLPGDALNPPAGVSGGALAGAAYAAMSANPGPAYDLEAALPLSMPYASDAELAQVIAVQVSFGDPGMLAELQARAHSPEIFDNASTVYTGTSDDGALNAGIGRFEWTPAAENFFRTWYEPTGDLSAPVLTLHTSRDPVVSPEQRLVFAGRVADLGRADRLVQRTFDRFGHCAVYDLEYGPAFDDLVNWVENGIQPTP
jgi:pimeloyl-ACP methyl ester carboxylesterase